MFNDNHILKNIDRADTIVSNLFYGVELFNYTHNRESIKPKNKIISKSDKNTEIIKHKKIFTLPMITLDNLDDDIYDYPEVEIVEIPVVKKVVFQFSKPVRLKFS